MAETQHRDARKLIPIIIAKAKKGETLTYREAAQLLGRPAKNHSRAVANICDLLDAAACLAGIPILALIIVRTESGHINPKAHRKDKGLRTAIIERSKRYRFGAADSKKLAQALTDLGQRGNRAAWDYVTDKYGPLLPSRLIGVDGQVSANAVDDLGTDTPDRARSEVWMYARNEKVREAVRRRAKGKCEFCGRPGFIKSDGTRYLEAHHIIALADDGEDRLTNVIALCPNDHREAHFGKRSKEIEKEMQQKLEIINISNSRPKADAA
jgi:alkylated DNA nucleotide flippase Atl1